MAEIEEERLIPKEDEYKMKTFVQGCKIFYKLLGDEKKEFGTLVLMLIVIRALELIYPIFIKYIFDDMGLIKSSTDFPMITIYFIIAIAGFKATIIVVNAFTRYPKFLKSIIRLENNMPVKALEKLLSLDMSYHEREHTGEKVSVIQKGVDKYTQIYDLVYTNLLPSLFYMLINAIILMSIDYRLGSVFFIPFIPAFYVGVRGRQAIAEDWEKWERLKEIAAAIFTQAIQNIATVQAYVQERYELERYRKIRMEMQEIDIRTSLTQHSKYYSVINAIMQFAAMLALVLGILMLRAGTTTPGNLFYLFTTGLLTIESMWNGLHGYLTIQKNMNSVFHMDRLFQQKSSIKNNPDAIVPTDLINWDLRMEDVSFMYEEKDVQTQKEEHITSLIEEGTTAGIEVDENDDQEDKDRPTIHQMSTVITQESFIGLGGETGAGKSTTIRLLGRQSDPTAGKVYLGQYDIRDLDVSWYRSHIATVAQKADIFSESLENNVRYGCRHATRAQVIEALYAAQLGYLLDYKKKPDETAEQKELRIDQALNRKVGENGIKLSGGERQRLAIARAYLKIKYDGARIVIIDEGTSNLDGRTEKAIKRMIDQLRTEHKITLIVIAHRLPTIYNADQILMMEKGSIKEAGTHEELSNIQGGIYKELSESYKDFATTAKV